MTSAWKRNAALAFSCSVHFQRQLYHSLTDWLDKVTRFIVSWSWKLEMRGQDITLWGLRGRFCFPPLLEPLGAYSPSLVVLAWYKSLAGRRMFHFPANIFLWCYPHVHISDPTSFFNDCSPNFVIISCSSTTFAVTLFPSEVRFWAKEISILVISFWRSTVQCTQRRYFEKSIWDLYALQTFW